MLLRRASDKAQEAGSIVAEHASKAAQQAGEKLSTAGEIAKERSRAAYRAAAQNPKTTAALVLGTGIVAAAIVWLTRRTRGPSRLV